MSNERNPGTILYNATGSAAISTPENRVDVVTEDDYDIARGLISGVEPFDGFGERSGITTTAAGEDIWRGAATTIPTPADVGEALEVVSTSAQDGVAGTGTLTLRVDYLDANGDPQTEDKTMNGTTPVALSATDVRFVQKIYTLTVGSNGVAAGDISIRNIGTPALIYSMIATGGNMSLVPHRMVPLGKLAVVRSWYATESKAKRVAYRIRATCEDGVLLPGVFLFKAAMYLNNSSLCCPVLFTAPALAIIKISGWGDATGGEASCGWSGRLYDA